MKRSHGLFSFPITATSPRACGPVTLFPKRVSDSRGELPFNYLLRMLLGLRLNSDCIFTPDRWIYETTLSADATPQVLRAANLTARGAVVSNFGPDAAQIMEGGIIVRILEGGDWDRLPLRGTGEITAISIGEESPTSLLHCSTLTCPGGAPGGDGSGGTVTYTSTQSFTATCPDGTTGDPFEASATKTSLVSQGDADALALAQATADANAGIVCVPAGWTLHLDCNLTKIVSHAYPFYAGYGDGSRIDGDSDTEIMIHFVADVSGTGTPLTAPEIEIIFSDADTNGSFDLSVNGASTSGVTGTFVFFNYIFSPSDFSGGGLTVSGCTLTGNPI